MKPVTLPAWREALLVTILFYSALNIVTDTEPDMPDSRIAHYTEQQIADARTEYPGCFLIERVLPGVASCLIAIPDTDDNRARITARFPLPDAALIDGLSFVKPEPATTE